MTEEQTNNTPQTESVDSLLSYNKSRPPDWETRAIQRIIDLSKIYTGRTHICHVSTSQVLEGLKTTGAHVSTGVTPHHLFFHYDTQFQHPGFGKVNPPLRHRKDCDSLIQGLRQGIIDIIESDHAPHTREEKEDIKEAPPGIPGVETTYPILLGKVKQGWLTLPEVIHAVSQKPGEIYHIQKGVITIGYDADFIITDMKPQPVDTLHSKCGWSPYEGTHAVFPRHVFVRGEKIIDNKEFVGARGMGQKIP